MSEPKHGGNGTATEVFENQTMYYGVCRCGWECRILRYEEMDAVDDYAGHIQQVLRPVAKSHVTPAGRQNQ